MLASFACISKGNKFVYPVDVRIRSGRSVDEAAIGKYHIQADDRIQRETPAATAIP